MLKIHQPYIKKEKVKYFLALASVGVFLLGSLVVISSSSESSTVYAAGESRTLSDISTMQEMTQQICSNSDEGSVARLKDIRDASYYNVYKASDGSCWMGENLNLAARTKITSDDSDVNSNYTLPASSDSSWSEDNNLAQMRTGYAGMMVSNESGFKGDGYGWRSGFGNYYSWCTATAMSCLQNRTDEAIEDIDAPESICPKGWKLPAYDGPGSFKSLVVAYRSNLITGQTINGVSNMAGLFLGYNSTSLTNGANLWFLAGYVLRESLSYIQPGGTGYYWGRRAIMNTKADELYLRNDNVAAYWGTGSRKHGYSIRCVAVGVEQPTFSTNREGNVTVNVSSILTIDATSGMDEIADASKVIEGTATATISSNTEYSVTLHSSEPALKDIDNSTNTSEISPVSSTNPVQPGNNSWGLWNGSGNASSKAYTLPITTTPQEFYNTTSSSTTDNGPTTTHTYYVGISISPALPSGTYGTDVVITASVK